MQSVICRAVILIGRRAVPVIRGAGPAVLLAAGLLAGCGAPARPAAASLPTATPSRPPPTSAVTPSLPPGFVPQAFTAISATHWWVLGSVPCGARDCPAIVATTDAGAAFQPLPAPGGRFGPGLNSPPAAGNIRFADSADGWAFDPGLYATHDGGRHWTAISVPGRVTDLEPGLGEVFAVVTPPSPPCARTGTCTSSTPAPRLWRAQPSSDHWSADPAAGRFAAAGPIQPAPTPDGYPNGSTLEAASPTTAVAASDLPGNPLIRTTDQGTTWSVVQAPADSTGTWSLIGFTTPEDGYALWEHGAATYQASTAQLWRTTDGGASWSPVKTLP
jgi:hypothetical protein